MVKKNEASQSTPEVKIADPLGELRTVFTERTNFLKEEAEKANQVTTNSLDDLKATLKKSISNQEKITTLVIIVMVIGFLVLLFALCSTLIVSWQANQTVHDAVQLQLDSRKSN